jgi:hypothetical protein
MTGTQTIQEKRIIKVKDFLADFRSGLSDDEMMHKYHITPTGLEKFYSMLLERGILNSEEFQGRYAEEPAAAADGPEEEPEGSSFICPCCLVAQQSMFESCPNCGIDVQEFLANEQGSPKPQADSPEEGSVNAGQTAATGTAEELSPLHAHRETGPIEIPFEDSLPEPRSDHGQAARADRTPRDDAKQVPEEHSWDFSHEDDAVPGKPFDYSFRDEPHAAESLALCEQCQERLFPQVRRVFEKKRSLTALALAGVALVLGALGATALTVFQGFSVLRLVVIYFTGMSMLLGCVMLGVGVFMVYLARERVFFCPSCGKVFPRL